MPVYVFQCRAHGRFDVTRSVEDAGKPLRCGCGEEARRVYTPQRLIVRPGGYRAKPGDRNWSLRRDLELGELKLDAPAEPELPEDRLGYEVSPDRIPDLSPDQMQDLSEWCQANVPE